MLKRPRATSPPHPALNSSYDTDFEEDDVLKAPRAKRVRFAPPDAWDSSARHGKEVRFALEPEQMEDTALAAEDGESGEEDGGYAVLDDSDTEDNDQQSAPSPPRHAPREADASSYASINTLLANLNATRANNSRHRDTLSSPPKPLPTPPPTRPGSNLLFGLRQHAPSVPSPLRRQVQSASSEPEPGSELKSPEEESEVVRSRYEDINRLLGSLVLSRRRAPREEDEVIE